MVKVKFCNALLRMLVVGVTISLKSVLRYTFIILNTYNPDTLYLREQECEDLSLFLEAKRDPQAKKFWKR
jgi:hypothetical protein